MDARIAARLTQLEKLSGHGTDDAEILPPAEVERLSAQLDAELASDSGEEEPAWGLVEALGRLLAHYRALKVDPLAVLPLSKERLVSLARRLPDEEEGGG